LSKKFEKVRRKCVELVSTEQEDPDAQTVAVDNTSWLDGARRTTRLAVRRSWYYGGYYHY
jgi:hypothetical protein